MAKKQQEDNQKLTQEDIRAAKARIAAEKDYAVSLGYANEELRKAIGLMKDQAKFLDGLVRSSKTLNDSTKQNAALKQDLASLYNNELQNAQDLLLKRNMISTGLKGDYAQYLTQYMIQHKGNEEMMKRLPKIIEELKHRQHLNEQTEKQVELIEDLAKYQEELNEELESYSMGWEKIKGKVKALLTTPGLAKAAFMTAMVEKSHEVFESFEKLAQSGLTVGQRVDYMTKGFSLMSLAGLSDTQGVLNGMVETMGSMNSLTSDEVDHIGHLAKEMGVTGQEAFALVEGFSKLPGETMETATHAADYVKSLAEANNVAPGKITKEIAKNTELMALGGYKGAKAFTDAAMKAQKMGVELSTTTSVMKGLLNFEDSINKQMEASVMLGREINLDKARQLALEGKSVEATAEVLKNIGGQAEFEKMNVLQKEALAAATGMTVEQLQKAVDAQEEYNKYHGDSVSGWKKMAGFAMEVGGGVFKLAKDYGLSLISLIGMVAQMRTMQAMNKMSGGSGGLFGSLFGKKGGAPMGPTPPPGLNQPPGGGPSGQAGMLSKINTGSLIKAAAAMAIAAAGIYIFGKAVQELEKVDWTKAAPGLGAFLATIAIAGAIGKFAGAGLSALAKGVASFGTPTAAAGVAILSLLVLSIGAGFMMLGKGVQFAATGMSLLVDSIGKLANAETVDNLFSVGSGLFYIASGLTAVGLAGLSAIPGLFAVTALAATGTKISPAKKEGGEEFSQMGLILKKLDDIDRHLSTPVIVNLDGRKVGEGSRQASNTTKIM